MGREEDNDDDDDGVPTSITIELPKLQESHHSFFRPQLDPTPGGANNSSSLPGGGSGGGSGGSGGRGYSVPAPEKKLTLFALHLAILEKFASGIGTLTFIWATVVLLGGFATSLKSIDFWFVTVILLSEGTRIFSRSHELEWQHHSTVWNLGATAGRSFRALISVYRSLIQALISIFNRRRDGGDDGGSSRRLRQQRPVSAFVSSNVSRGLVWLQLSSAVTCVGLSLARLAKQDYGENSGDGGSRNRRPSLNVFYAGALAEALMFLTEKAYWTWRVSHRKLLETVSQDCELGPAAGVVSVRRFFYDSYSKSIQGSIFDGLRMDLVSFAKELLDSESRDEQLIGIQILNKFTSSDRFAYDTLRKIGTSTWVIERLIEMLNWKSPAEEEIRKCAAQIVSKLAGKKLNALRVAGIPGAIESISSLLYTSKKSGGTASGIAEDEINYDFWGFNLLGLLIFKKLAHDHDNCYKIGNTRGLLSKIIDLTGTTESLLRNPLAPESQVKVVKRSLKVVKMLVITTGSTGKMLRQEISEIVFTVSHIREIIQHGESHMVLQKLSMEILTSLAIEKEGKEMISRTGGIIKLLVSIFFRPGITEDDSAVSNEAGEALTMLALQSRTNCDRLMKEPELLVRLVDALGDPAIQANASRILRNLCAYSSSERLAGVTVAFPTVLRTIMEAKEKQLEVAIGLATQICKFMSSEEFTDALDQASITDAELVQKLMNELKERKYPDTNIPRVRRFIIEQVNWMMKSDRKYIRLFKNCGIETLLECVADTTSELECFHVFSGSVGISRHHKSLASLVETALDQLMMVIN